MDHWIFVFVFAHSQHINIVMDHTMNFIGIDSKLEKYLIVFFGMVKLSMKLEEIGTNLRPKIIFWHLEIHRKMKCKNKIVCVQDESQTSFSGTNWRKDEYQFTGLEMKFCNYW